MSRSNLRRHYLVERGKPPLGYNWLPEEIVKLARLNPGYGLGSLASTLYPKNGQKNAHIIMLILQEHKKETGEDLLEHLQNPDYMVETDMVEVAVDNIKNGRNILTGINTSHLGARLSRSRGAAKGLLELAVNRMTGKGNPRAGRQWVIKVPPPFIPLEEE